MSENFIKDGTGRGYSAKVDSSNRLNTFSVTATEYDYVSQLGRAFNVNTQEVTPASSSETPVLKFKNGGNRTIVVEAFFFGTGGPQTGTGDDTVPCVIAIYPKATNVTGGVAVPVVNRLAGASYDFGIEAMKHDAGTPLLVDGTSTPSSAQLGDPVIWQWQSKSVGARSFGVIHVSVPAGQELVVTVKQTGTLIAPIYTGFTGFVVEDI